MPTRAAIPSEIEMEKRSNRRRLDLLSRHAIFQMKGEFMTSKNCTYLWPSS